MLSNDQKYGHLLAFTRLDIDLAYTNRLMEAHGQDLLTPAEGNIPQSSIVLS